jgi:hypothetical protein
MAKNEIYNIFGGYEGVKEEVDRLQRGGLLRNARILYSKLSKKDQQKILSEDSRLALLLTHNGL